MSMFTDAHTRYEEFPRRNNRRLGHDDIFDEDSNSSRLSSLVNRLTSFCNGLINRCDRETFGTALYVAILLGLMTLVIWFRYESGLPFIRESAPSAHLDKLALALLSLVYIPFYFTMMPYISPKLMRKARVPWSKAVGIYLFAAFFTFMYFFVPVYVYITLSNPPYPESYMVQCTVIAMLYLMMSLWIAGGLLRWQKDEMLKMTKPILPIMRATSSMTDNTQSTIGAEIYVYAHPMI